jgi:tetratricopeptide (TPR) repeat protein
MWDRILAARPPTKYERGPGDPGGFTFATAMWHYARCLALASVAQHAQQAQHAATARRHQQEAEAELGLLQRAVAALPPDVTTRPGQGVGIYSPGYQGLGPMAVGVAKARLLALDGQWHNAAGVLDSAAEAELGMGYVEPPRLLQQPLLQCLGWVYLHMGRYDAATEAYRKDLSHHPGNGWALLGLSQALMRSGHSVEAAEARESFQRAWQHADQSITSSCPAFAQ